MGAAALGYAPEDLVGRPWTDFIHPLDLDRSMDESARARRERQRHARVENRWKAADGGDRWLLWTVGHCRRVRRLRGGQGHTELKEAQSALRAIEARHRTALTGLEEGVVLQDSGSRILLADPAARRILGLGDVVIGAVSEDPGWETLREDGSVLSREEQPFATVMRTGRPQIGVLLGLRWRGGDVRWLRVSARPVEPFEGGGPAPVVSSFVDVTQLKAVQDELRDSEARFRSLAASTPVGIFLTDRAGKVVYFNPALEAVAKRFGDVAPGSWIETAVHRDDRDRVARGWAEAVAERRPYADDYRSGPPRRPDSVGPAARRSSRRVP